MARKEELDKLSRDMVQCEKDGFGVQYGRWMAYKEQQTKSFPTVLSKDTKENENEEQNVRLRVCPVCGESFMPPDNRNRVCCSPECKETRRLQQEKERRERRAGTTREKLIVCAGCGRLFVNATGRNKKYCSSACKAGVYRRRMMDQRQEKDV